MIRIQSLNSFFPKSFNLNGLALIIFTFEYIFLFSSNALLTIFAAIVVLPLPGGANICTNSFGGLHTIS